MILLFLAASVLPVMCWEHHRPGCADNSAYYNVVQILELSREMQQSHFPSQRNHELDLNFSIHVILDIMFKRLKLGYYFEHSCHKNGRNTFLMVQKELEYLVLRERQENSVLSSRTFGKICSSLLMFILSLENNGCPVNHTDWHDLYRKTWHRRPITDIANTSMHIIQSTIGLNLIQSDPLLKRIDYFQRFQCRPQNYFTNELQAISHLHLHSSHNDLRLLNFDYLNFGAKRSEHEVGSDFESFSYFLIESIIKGDIIKHPQQNDKPCPTEIIKDVYNTLWNITRQNKEFPAHEYFSGTPGIFQDAKKENIKDTPVFEHFSRNKKEIHFDLKGIELSYQNFQRSENDHDEHENNDHEHTHDHSSSGSHSTHHSSNSHTLDCQHFHTGKESIQNHFTDLTVTTNTKSNKCFSVQELLDIYSFNSESITEEQFLDFCPALLHHLFFCKTKQLPVSLQKTTEEKSNFQKYGYGTICVVLISLCALVGVVFVKCLNKESTAYIMSALVALAVSCLLGDAFLHLLPHALLENSHHAENEQEERKQIFKMCGGMGCLYLFFILDLLLHHHHGSSNKVEIEGQSCTTDCTVSRDVQLVAINNLHENVKKNNLNAERNIQRTHSDGSDSAKSSEIFSITSSTSMNGESTVNKTDDKRMSLVLMIVVGEIIHNFADGLAIGAAFTENVTEGFSTALAVFCHELPHELGDFAALISAGLSAKKAVLINLSSTLSAFVGLYIGIPFGAEDEARSWIFSCGAGMFIYVALTTLTPELIQNFEKKRNFKMFLALNVGMILGFVSMLCLALFEDDIKINL